MSIGALIKRIDASWVTGTNQGGLSSSLTVANTTWYHVFAIKVAGVDDVGFDTSFTAANLIADHSATAYRYLWSVLTDGSANIVPYFQNGKRGDWDSPTLDISASDSTTAATRTVKVPTGLPVEAKLSANVSGGGQTYISSLDQTNLAPSLTVAPLHSHDDSVANRGATPQHVMTNTSGQVRSRSSGSHTIRIVTNGWRK